MNKDTDNDKNTLRITGNHTKPIIEINVKKYEHYLENSGLTDEEKIKYLETLRDILIEFTWFAFGMHPLQQLENGCGEDSEKISLDTILTQDVLNSTDQQISDDFKDIALPDKAPQGEGVEA